MSSETKFSEFSQQLRETVSPAPTTSWQLSVGGRRIVAGCVGLVLIAGFVVARGLGGDRGGDAPMPRQTAAVINTVPPQPTVPTVTPPAVSAQALRIAEVETGQIVYEMNSHVRWPLASVTKLVTAAVALEQLGPDEHIPMTESAVATEGTSGGFKAGETYTSRDLITAMMTVSSNDAATALAEFYDSEHGLMNQPAAGQPMDGSVAASGVPISKTAYFTEAMQKFAQRIGMQESVFGDPTGLSPINQTTAPDLAILVRYITTQHPDIFIPSRRKSNFITELVSGSQRELLNINQFAGREDFVGGKTGFTDEAKGNLVSVFLYNGKNYSIVLLGTDNNRFTETLTAYEWLKEHSN